jgi:hypothetical protein
VILALLLYFIPVSSVQAIRGTPGSSEFGFGALVDLNGQSVEDGIQLASNLQLDWVKVEVSWSALQSTKGGELDWSSCDQAFQSLSHYKLNSLVSITQPPAWSLTAHGPDSALALKFIQQILQKYGPSIAALELFPAANTRAGWGTAPDPGAYMALWKTVSHGLEAAKTPVLLVAGGLVPGKTDSKVGRVDDLEFLQGMYSAGARDLVQVVSLQLLNPTNAPEAAPDQSELTVLRHYEEIRQVMLHNDHGKGMLWITGMGIPQSLDAFGAATDSLQQKQADWLAQAFNQLRSQLYIGVAFLDSINPASAPSGSISLITPTGDLHPAFRVLRDQIAQNAAGASYPRPGRAKSETLVKGH